MASPIPPSPDVLAFHELADVAERSVGNLEKLNARSGAYSEAVVARVRADVVRRCNGLFGELRETMRRFDDTTSEHSRALVAAQSRLSGLTFDRELAELRYVVGEIDRADWLRYTEVLDEEELQARALHGVLSHTLHAVSAGTSRWHELDSRFREAGGG